jgi:prepilin signal peptidase PulO-like enzyme (type II secretory pathway)
MFIEILAALFFGLMLGNYGTTVYYRLPRGIKINGHAELGGKAPHASCCQTPLKFYEYLPVLSWFSTFGKCSYCAAKVDINYYIIEIGSTICSIVLVLALGLNFSYIIAELLATILVTSTVVVMAKRLKRKKSR